MAEEHDEQHEGESHGSGSHGGGHGHAGGGHAEGEHEGAPEWLISFADNVALMMGFFVILLAMNMGPKGKSDAGGDPSNEPGTPSTAMLDFVIGMREGFGNPIDLSSKKAEEQPFINRMRELRGEGDTNQVPGRHKAQQSLRPTNFSSIGAKISFDDDSTALNSAARETIAEAAKKLKGQRYYIELRGHVSPSEAMHDVRRAMKLSYDRAITVFNALVEQGISPAQLIIRCYGDNDRIVPNTWSRENDRTNQRVEIVISSEQLPPDPYSKDASSEPREESK
jgi:outer membrane protein OmpA-like peptidoglycan-associated protein